jgi:hypothetical protein
MAEKLGQLFNKVLNNPLVNSLPFNLNINAEYCNAMDVTLVSHHPNIVKMISEIPEVSLDLKHVAHMELDFLKLVDDNRKLYYNPEYIANAIVRYEKYWLPLLAKLSSKMEEDLRFAPPMDIHWVWHVHMLAPVSYSNDCKVTVGRKLGHALRPLELLEDLRKSTKTIWEEHYPGVPFVVDLTTLEKPDTLVKEASTISYDIKAAALRQGVFYYQVSLDHYRDPEFLFDSEKRYRMYLYLKKMNPQTFLVPCYDIDLMWHTHQVHTGLYGPDMIKILGFVLKHDDSVNDRSEGSKLNDADEVTRKLWKKTFGVSFGRPGSMFRGNPPNGRLHPLTETYQKGLQHPREIDVQIGKIQFNSLPADHPLPEQAVLSLKLEQCDVKDSKHKPRQVDLFKRGCVLKKAASVDEPDKRFANGSVEIVSETPGDPLVKFSIGQRSHPKLMVKLNKPKKHGLGSLLPGRRHSLASSEVPIDLFGLLPKDLNELSTKPTDFTVTHKLSFPSPGSSSGNGHHHGASGASSGASNDVSPEAVETTVTLELSNERFGKQTDTCFTIQVGSFYDCIIPEQIEKLWGPIPLQKLPKGIDNRCRAVTHG